VILPAYKLEMLFTFESIQNDAGDPFRVKIPVSQEAFVTWPWAKEIESMVVDSIENYRRENP
jgi:hypothetical protein